MSNHHTESGSRVNRLRSGRTDTLVATMGNEKTTKKVLWENVQALMVLRYGRENLTKLATEAKIGQGGATRIKQAETSVGLDVLEKVAKHFGVEPWQLITPGLNDEKFLAILTVWNETDGRGRRMLLRAAEGAAAEDEQSRTDRKATRVAG